MNSRIIRLYRRHCSVATIYIATLSKGGKGKAFYLIFIDTHSIYLGSFFCHRSKGETTSDKALTL